MPTKPKSKKSLYNLKANKSGQWSKNSDKFYHSSKWRKLRIQVLIKNPMCVHCQRNGDVTLATVADHIKPVSQGGEIWSINNLQGLCESCHNTKSSKESKL